MNNLQENNENYNETELPITIFTGYKTEQDNKFSVTRQQLEKSAHYIQSLFNSIKTLKKAAEKAEGNEQLDSLEDIENLTQIGYGLAEFVLNNAQIIYEAEQLCNSRLVDTLDAEVLQ